MTRNELAGAVLEWCHDGARSFCQQLRAEFEGTPFAVTDENQERVFLEGVILHMWLASKVLAPEKDLLNRVHDRFFEDLHSRGASGTTLNVLQDRLRERYGRYYASWNDEAKGSQFALGLEVFQCLVNGGRPDRGLLSHSIVNALMSILGFMSKLADARSKIQIKEA